VSNIFRHFDFKSSLILSAVARSLFCFADRRSSPNFWISCGISISFDLAQDDNIKKSNKSNLNKLLSNRLIIEIISEFGLCNALFISANNLGVFKSSNIAEIELLKNSFASSVVICDSISWYDP